MIPPVPLPRIAPILALAALLVAAGVIAGIAAALLPPPPDAAAQSSSRYSPCYKEIGVSYFGGKGAPYFTGIPNAEIYEPVTVKDGRRTVVRNLIDISNSSEAATCPWRVTSKTQNWVTLSSESGTIPPDKHHTIGVSINANAKSLRPGLYQARIRFQLGPDSDGWTGSAVVNLEVLDECYIKVRDADRLDIRDGGRVARWQGTIGRTDTEHLQHRVIVWNPSNSQCRLSAETNRRWLEAEFQDATTIGKGDTAALILSANDRWEGVPTGTEQAAAITIHDAISGAAHLLHVVLETEHPPCQLAVRGDGRLQFDGVARSVKPLAGQIQLENLGGEICRWRAASDQTWLQVTPREGDVWGGNVGDPVTIAIVDAAANGLKSSAGEGNPHSGSITFSYLVRGITKTEAVTTALHLSKPPCEMSVHTSKAMEIHYTRGETIHPERHHLQIRVSNADDSQDCDYQASLPNWLDWTESDAGEGTVSEGKSIDITVKLKADAPEAQAAKQEYDDIITFAVADADSKEVPVRLETGCPVGDACAYLHTSHTEIRVGDIAEMTYTVSSPLNQEVRAKLTLDLPSGWQMDGEGFAQKCSGVCQATYDVAAGDQRHIGMRAYPNHAGEFPLEGRAEYIRMENGVPELVPYASSQETITINVLPKEPAPASPPAAAATVVPTPAATPTPTPSPTETPAPTATPAAVSVALMQPPGADSAPASPPPVVPPDPDPFTNVLLIAVIAAVAILALIVIALAVVVLRRGGGTPAPPQVPPTRPQQQQPRPAPTRPGAPGNQRR